MKAPQEKLGGEAFEELNELMGALREGTITDDQTARLDQLLAESPAAMEAFSDMILLVAQLHWTQGRKAGVVNPEVKVHLSFLRAPRTWYFALAASLVLILSLIAGKTIFNAKRPEIAMVKRAINANWIGSPANFRVGKTLRPGWVRIKSGVVELEFNRGARVILQGPVSLKLVSENETYLDHGTVSAFVPGPARGFKLSSSQFTAVDYGTEFGCKVFEGQSPEIHVFAGQVGVRAATLTAERLLEENQAVRLSANGVESISADRKAFLNEADLTRDDSDEAGHLKLWKASRHLLAADPAALVYLDFERAEPLQGLLPNRAVHALPHSDARVNGCVWEQGRWRGKGAMEFKSYNDNLTLDIPGQFNSLTLMAWIRVDRLPEKKQQGLLMTKSMEKGAIQWYLQSDGSLGLGFQLSNAGEPQRWRCLHSPPVYRKESLGNWILAACVIDGTEGTVTHYCNGMPMGTILDGSPIPVSLGTVGVGNWPSDPQDRRWVEWLNQGGGAHSINLNGRLDEFAIFTRSMSAKEIRAIYEKTYWAQSEFAKQELTPNK